MNRFSNIFPGKRNIPGLPANKRKSLKNKWRQIQKERKKKGRTRTAGKKGKNKHPSTLRQVQSANQVARNLQKKKLSRLPGLSERWSPSSPDGTSTTKGSTTKGSTTLKRRKAQSQKYNPSYRPNSRSLKRRNGQSQKYNPSYRPNSRN